ERRCVAPQRRSKDGIPHPAEAGRPLPRTGMGRRLAAAVHVLHPKSNEWLILQPGDEPDEDLAEAITNPAAWEPDEDDEESLDDGGEGEPPVGGANPDPAPEPTPAPAPEPAPAAEPTPAPAAEAKPARAKTRKQADEQ
ncbi:hypothetical protein ACFYXB_42500, partial [Streptomyces sp. NPDC002619]